MILQWFPSTDAFYFWRPLYLTIKLPAVLFFLAKNTIRTFRRTKIILFSCTQILSKFSTIKQQHPIWKFQLVLAVLHVNQQKQKGVICNSILHLYIETWSTTPKMERLKQAGSRSIHNTCSKYKQTNHQL